MKWLRARAVLFVAWAVGCNSGGSGFTTVPSSAWPRFRHDTAHTGAGIGRVGGIRSAPIAIPVDSTPPYSPVISSPALGIDGTAYVLSSAGTLAALKSTGEVKWRAQACELCPAERQNIGSTFSSPTVHAPPTGASVIYIGSNSGRVYAFEDRRDHAACTLCFDANLQRPGFSEVRFLAPVTLLTHVVTGKVTQVLAPAIVRRDANAEDEGLLFSLSSSGELLWTYPRSTAYPAGFVTAVAFGAGSTAFVGSADGWLHALHLLLGGEPAWRTFVGPFTDVDTPVALAPMTSANSVFAYTSTGKILALEAVGGTVVWQRDLGATGIAASAALGVQAAATHQEATPTPTRQLPPTASQNATPVATPMVAGSATPSSTSTPTATATPTVTPLTLVPSLFVLSKGGRFLAIDARNGNDIPTGDVHQAIEGEVLSSPALSLDGYLVFGSSQGSLYAIHNGSGLSAWPPIVLAPGVPIRSSPAIASDGTIWIGGDSGYVYRVGGQ